MMRFIFVGVFKYCFLVNILVLEVCCTGTGYVSMQWGTFDNMGHRLTKRKDLDPQTCMENFDIHPDKIIRTEDSREMGAEYINEVDLGSREECLRLCCETDKCDVFVYEEKEAGSCYMFRCGPPEDFKCKFTRHTNFTSAVLAISRRLAELEDQIRLTKHEQELASLRKQVQEEQMLARARDPLVVKNPSAPTTTIAVPTPPRVYRKQTTVSTPPVRRCSRYQFECHNSGECIAIYNACDGIAQCTDGSDEAPELGCPETASPTTAGASAGVATPALTPAQREPPAPPKELMPPPQVYDSSGEPVIQKGPSENRPPFMRPVNQEPIQWPNRLSQMQQPIQNMQMKPYEDERRSRIFNHKGGLQVTEADGAAPSQYDYKAIPYENIPETWQHRQWPPQPNPDQLISNDGRQMYHMEMEPVGQWKQMTPVSDNDQRQMDNIMPRMRPMPQQIIEKYDDRSSDSFEAGKNKMWPVPQSPIKASTPIRYPEVMSNSQRNYALQPSEHTSQEKEQSIKQNSNKSLPNEVPLANASEDDLQNTNHVNQKLSKNNNKEDIGNNEENSKEKTRKHKEKGDKFEVEEDDVIKETSIMVTRKKIIEEDEDDHDGLSASPPGAIIILIIGLFMTGTMMVMICWRAKLSRRRRRGGKGGYAHDADYLVNGMYL